ncbi:phosphate signaling complex protein PhoU [Ruminococcus sp. Marseille-P6503]|uniref:phosphate signaling complex protein PhoU n=1 Tax=Ruminococcus sp. Marseille-P6503 TaxID=2364796 RepID=UPI000F545B34|nr:phosphate signaling complex protein PhoU [Ruminococcus sp. Marseille-P6503]
MRESFDKQLSQLNILLMNMAALVEQIIAMSIKSLEEQNTELAGQTVEFDSKINDLEREIERLCLKLLLQYQPVFADDLRRVSTALKMITDMERIGDQAADIAQLNITLIAQKKSWELDEISQMARGTALMVSQSIDAYVNHDEELAGAVIAADDDIDDLFSLVKNKVIEQIAADKSKGEQAVDTVMIAKYFERIGDHAVNIAEWVLFSITGVHKSKRIM